MHEARRWLAELTGRPAPSRVEWLLERLAPAEFDASDLVRYHDALLLEAAYPRSQGSWRLASRALAGFGDRISALDPDELEQLCDSGIVGAPQLYPYDLCNAEWFAGRPDSRVEIAWELVEPRSRRQLERLVALVLEPVERPATGAGGWSARRILDAVRGRQSAFGWLATRLRARYPRPIGNYLFDSCDLPLRVEPGPAGPSRTLGCDAPPRRPVLHRGGTTSAGADFLAEVTRPMKLGRPVARRRGEALLGVVRQMILSRTRELHAMTHGNPDEVYVVPLDRGSTLTVWLLRPEHRLPLEVGWYFMMLRNGIPVAYGGGGLFAARAEVGMNLFEEFRGAREAAWILAQVCRAALSLCPAPWIVTRRYQFGGDDNEEGIERGAYWFYDKLGFRSVDARVRALAARERQLLARRTGYRTPKRVLRRLASADLVLPLRSQDPAAYREYPLGAVGLRLCQAITARFGTARSNLEAWLGGAGGGAIGKTARAKPRRGQGELFALISEPRDGPLIRRLARLKGGRHEARYAAALPSALPWLERIAADCY